MSKMIGYRDYAQLGAMEDRYQESLRRERCRRGKHEFDEDRCSNCGEEREADEDSSDE